MGASLLALAKSTYYRFYVKLHFDKLQYKSVSGENFIATEKWRLVMSAGAPHILV